MIFFYKAKLHEQQFHEKRKALENFAQIYTLIIDSTTAVKALTILVIKYQYHDIYQEMMQWLFLAFTLQNYEIQLWNKTI